MNLTVLLLLVGVGYVVYTILESYRSMSRELREIRLKCMLNTPTSLNLDPMDTIKFQILKGLSQLKDMAEKE